VLGINIQKEEITKNKSESPKKMFKKNKGCELLALCKCVILSKMSGSSLTEYSAFPLAWSYVPFLKNRIFPSCFSTFNCFIFNSSPSSSGVALVLIS
jgi:hypothetical protein